MSTAQHTHRLPGAFLLVVLCALVGCSDPQAPAPRSLASPGAVVGTEWCRADDGGQVVQVPVERCASSGDLEGSTIRVGLVVNRERESLMMADLSSTIPRWVDLNLGEPAVTGIPVCEGPAEVVVLPDGLMAAVRCPISRELVFVAVPERRVALRQDREVLERTMVASSADPILAFARPATDDASGQVVVERVDWTCDGQAEVMPVDCVPEVTLSEEAVLDVEGSPAHLTFDSEGSLYVTYADRSYLSRFALSGGDAVCLEDGASAPCEVARVGLVRECGDGIDNDGDGLVDQADLQCYGPGDSESPEGLRGINTACTDGEDNDGDGAIDHDDADCLAALDGNETGAVLPDPCTDGEDNDGDGDADDADADCAIAGWGQETSPACSDGIDNDGDGDVDFSDDADCEDEAWNSESAGADADAAACANGIDDDGDGTIDRADPGCSGLDDDDESAAAPVCSDGVDNDEDGLVDASDPDCYGAAGDTERGVAPDGFGPIALQFDTGRYLLISDQVRHQILVVDTALNELLDAGAGDYIREGLGIPFSSTSVIGPPAGYRLTADRTDASLDDIEAGIEQELAIVPTSNGFGTAVTLSLTHFEEVGGERTEGVDTPLRPQDGNSSGAEVREIACEVNESFREAVREARDTQVDVRVNCDDPEVPQIVAADDETGVELVQEQRFTVEDGRLIDESAPFDYRLRSELWSLAYEGVLPNTQREDGLIHADAPGVLVSRGPNFCSRGIEAGDRVIITASTPSLTADEGACDAFSEVTLEYGVDYVRADSLYLSVIDEEGLAQALPTRECFAEAFEYEVRVAGEWLVTGALSGLVHNTTSLSEVCLPATDDERRTARLTQAEPFENVFFSLELSDPGVPATRGLLVTFGVDNNFATTAVSLGPSTQDTAIASGSGSSRRLLVSDGGTNQLLVFDADTLLLLTTLF